MKRDKNGREIQEVQAYGTWTVTTEGDCEGRTTTNLGTHTGYIDDIAFALADKTYYGLRFEYVDPMKLVKSPPKAAKVQVSLGIETGTWDHTRKERVQYFKKLLAGRNTLVREGQYYACVELVSGLSPEAQGEAVRRVLIESALSKLTPEELQALKADHRTEGV